MSATVLNPVRVNVASHNLLLWPKCQEYGPRLLLSDCVDDAGQPLRGDKLLYAIAGNESSFGRIETPRFEPAYFNGRYSLNPQQEALNKQFGTAGACSYGCWQVMLVNCSGYTPTDLLDLDHQADATCKYLNRYVLEGQQAKTLEHIAQTYNSGNWHNAPQLGVEMYMKSMVRFYHHTPEAL